MKQIKTVHNQEYPFQHFHHVRATFAAKARFYAGTHLALQAAVDQLSKPAFFLLGFWPSMNTHLPLLPTPRGSHMAKAYGEFSEAQSASKFGMATRSTAFFLFLVEKTQENVFIWWNKNEKA